MKKTILILCILFYSPCFAAETEENPVAETAKTVVSGIVSFTKNIIGGVTEGVNDGRKTGQSADGAVIVDTLEGLDQNLGVQLIAVAQDGEGNCFVEIGFKNDTENPVRLIDLNTSEKVIAIDADGYAVNLSKRTDNPIEVTVPSQAGKKQKFYFAIAPESVKEFRIMGKVLSRQEER